MNGDHYCYHFLFCRNQREKAHQPCTIGAEHYQPVSTLIHRIPPDYIRGLITVQIQIPLN